ncbi:MAG: protein kinase [Phycisphaeraceae bacterium]|nr:protein kinase [Phycisphaeraceae bacterium]
MGPRCLSRHDLERYAKGEHAEDAAHAHIQACSACAEAIAEIRENERFLGDARSALVGVVGHPPPRVALPANAVRGFELGDEISRGGQGVVYRAVQTSTKRSAAIKVLLGGAFASDRQRHRFEREVEIAARLRHPNIVSVFESGQTTDGSPYVAMEFVDGVALDAFVEQRYGALKRSDRERINGVVALMAMIAAGVGHAHTAGVMHRDLKPSNILVDREGKPRVLDFGLARASEPSRDLSTTREFVGTPAYASPEQLAGDPASVNARTDVYALGLILYALLTGRHPYPVVGSIAELARHAIETEPTPPSRHVARLPSDIQTIVLKCLAKDPERRYANGAALASDLEDYLQGHPISARRDSTAYVLRKLAMRHRAPAIAALLVLLTIVGATIGLALLASDLDAARRDAERALADSDIQRARMIARMGNPAQAEELIWSRAVGHTFASGSGTLTRATGETLRDAWALAELYAASPCILRLEPDVRFHVIGFGEEGATLWAVDEAMARWTWTLDGRLVDRTAPLVPALGWNDFVHSNDGRLLVIERDREILTVDIDNSTMISRPTGRAGSNASYICPRGKYIVSLSRGTHSGVIVRETSGLSELFSADQRYASATWMTTDSTSTLVLGTFDHDDLRIEFRSIPDWRLERLVPVTIDSRAEHVGVRCVRVSPDGTLLAYSIDENIFVHDLVRPDAPQIAHAVRPATITDIQVAPSGDHVIVRGIDGIVASLRLPDLELERSISVGTDSRRIASSEPDNLIASINLSGGLALHSLADRPWMERIPSVEATKACVDVAPGGTIAWGDEDGMVHVLPGGEPARAFTFAAHGLEVGVATAVNSICFSPDGRKLITAGMDGVIAEWTPDGTLIRTISRVRASAWSAQYSPQGDAIAAGFSDGTFRVWREGIDDPIVVQLAQVNRVPSLKFSPDGHRIVAATVGGGVIVADAQTGETIVELPIQHTFSRAVEWSRDGSRIYTASDDNKIRVWDGRTYVLLRTISGLPWGPFSIRLHPDGNILFVVGRGGELFVLDPERGIEIARLDVGTRHIFSIALSPAGERVILSGQDAPLYAVDLARLGDPVAAQQSWWRSVLVRKPPARPGPVDLPPPLQRASSEDPGD